MIQIRALFTRNLVRPAAGSPVQTSLRTYVFVPQRGRVNNQARPGKKTAKQKQDERRRARIARFAPPDEEVIYGHSVILAALQAGRRDLRTLYVKEEPEKDRKLKPITDLILNTAMNIGVPIERVSKGELNELTNYQVHQGVALRASGLQPTHLTSITQYQNGQYYGVTPPTKLLEFTTEKHAPVWLALDEVQDPRNLGAIIRSAYYFGVDGVLVCRKNSAPFTPVCSKASAGAVELMDLYYTNKMMKFLRACRTNGWAVVGATAAPRSQSIGSSSLIPMNRLGKTEQGVILVVGNEGYGLRPMVRKKCTHHVAIPSTNPTRSPLIDSLNVSVASALLLNSFMRNRLEARLGEFENLVPPPNPLNTIELEDEDEDDE
ncbi:Alpha/beta knot methyltransferase [Thamnocephalis sphaerospora]|uniref:rRNA methyltransferase 1, mitochondrial n=1 Tax=Thamnocephalis sphaerospora TaxID=78915 RepID=A0A4P9XVD9_9FUNG|nr:Alpha/beta knot methyltransferase [Thamnocephalis sphaerospora]|eukprot:RKP09370.1 Alpha/beta knot methyltransferase [Thamnocephalis sphaerospora]